MNTHSLIESSRATREKKLCKIEQGSSRNFQPSAPARKTILVNSWLSSIKVPAAPG
jgi:hypothetical protein